MAGECEAAERATTTDVARRCPRRRPRLLPDTRPHGSWKMDASASSRKDAVESYHAAESIGHGSSADRHADHTAKSAPFQSSSGIVQQDVRDDGENKCSRKPSLLAHEPTDPPGHYGCESCVTSPLFFGTMLICGRPNGPNSLLPGICSLAQGIFPYYCARYSVDYGPYVDHSPFVSALSL